MSSLLVLNLELRFTSGAADEVLRDETTDELVWDTTDGHTDWNGEETESDGVTPATTVKRWIGGNGEGLASDEDDQDLEPDHDDVDTDKEFVFEDTLEDVELVVQTTVTSNVLVSYDA